MLFRSTGNDLLRLMQSSDFQEKAVAMGYVAGAIDMGDQIIFCSPNGRVTIGQTRDILQIYLENNPALRHLPADALIIDVFKKLWPCPKRGTAL